MISNKVFESKQHENDLQGAIETIWAIAQEHGDDSLALLTILRKLESLHQQIRDSLFQRALPDNRQSLYNLLRDIEAEGGWPYIYRIKLQGLLEKLDASTIVELQPSPSQPPQSISSKQT